MECRDLDRLLPAYADGEFAPAESAEADLHLAGCAACREEVAGQLAFRSFLQTRASEAAAPPPALRARIRRDIARERAVDNLRRFAAYSAVAASLVIVASTGYVVADSSDNRPLDMVLDAVEKHARALPVEVTPASGDVDSWFRGKVDFNVRTPHFRSPTGPRLVGARLASIHDHEAAYFVYGGKNPNERTTLLVFPGGDVEFPDGHKRHIGGRDVTVANERGYNVALWKQQGIVYSLVSDLDEKDVLRLVSEVDDH